MTKMTELTKLTEMTETLKDPQRLLKTHKDPQRFLTIVTVTYIANYRDADRI